VSVVKPVVGIILVSSMNDKVTARIIGIAFVELVFFFGLFVSMMRGGKRFFDGHYWKYALYFNLPLIPHYLSQRLLNSADRIMIEKLVDSSSAGIYSLAYSLALLLQLVNTAIRDSISPWTFKKIKSGNVEDIHTVTYPALIVVAVFNYLLIAFAPEIVKIFAPPAYYEAIWVIPPVTMSVYLMFLYTLFSDFEFYFEKTKFMSIATMSGAVVNIVLNLVFIPLFGYKAAGYTTLFCYFLYAVLHYCIMRRICAQNFPDKKVYDIKMITLISFVFLGMGFVTMVLYSSPILRYMAIAIIVVVCVIYKNKILEFINVLKQARSSRN
jgi:O-antigen/teichoic acid export membrane protein